MAKFNVVLETKLSNGDLVLYRLSDNRDKSILAEDYYVLFKIINTEIRTFEDIPFVKVYYDILNAKDRYDIIENVSGVQLIKYDENDYEQVKTDIISSRYKIYRKKAK